MLLKAHVANNIGPKRPGGVGEDGGTKSRMKFSRDGRAADLMAALNNQRLESGLGQIEGGDQSIVAAADDNDVARVRHLV